MNKTIVWSIVSAIGAFILANLIDYSTLQFVMKGDLNSVAEKHISDSRDIKLKTIDVTIDLAEEKIKRIKMDLLENQVKQENLKTDNVDIPVM